MRILAIVADVPDPPISGARVRNYHLWPAISELGHEVKIVGLDFSGASAHKGAMPGLNKVGEFFPPERSPMPIRAWRAMTRSHYERARTSRLAERVDELSRSWTPDIIHAEELLMGFYLPRFRGQPCEALQTITLHNVESRLFHSLGIPSGGRLEGALHSCGPRFLKNGLHTLQLRSLERYEQSVGTAADLVFTYSPIDYRFYTSAYPGAAWRQTRNGVDARGIRALPQSDVWNLLLLGTLSYYPNAQGLQWFLDKVWPHLRPGFSLTVAGSHASQLLREKTKAAGARFVDTPRELEPLYRECAISVVPLLQGSGTRTKILEACAYERMVITTTVGLEGLDLVPGKEGVVVADSPEDFAGAIEYWSEAKEERAALSARGREAVLKRYDWSTVAGNLVSEWARARSLPRV